MVVAVRGTGSHRGRGNRALVIAGDGSEREALCALAIGIGMASSYLGLLLSYYFSVPSGPAIILVAGGFYALSLIFGTRGIVRTRMTSPRHRIA